MGRAYDNSNRARLAAETSERIVSATEALIGERDLAAITLAAIAERANVSVQTVLRHLGSRDGCLDAVRHRVRTRIAAQRRVVVPGDVAGALAGLLEHYELEGRLVLRMLAQEGRDRFATDAVAEGRDFHRSWIVHCFGPLLPPGDEVVIDALVGVTDLYLWKLYRLDLQRSRGATERIFTHLVEAVLESSCRPS